MAPAFDLSDVTTIAEMFGSAGMNGACRLPAWGNVFMRGDRGDGRPAADG
jgi:hypothetical protein